MKERLRLLRSTMAEVDLVTSVKGSGREVLQNICDVLTTIPGYDWAGFYIVHPSSDRKLVLGPYYRRTHRTREHQLWTGHRAGRPRNLFRHSSSAM